MISVGDIVPSFDPSATAQDDKVDDFGDSLPRVSFSKAILPFNTFRHSSFAIPPKQTRLINL